MAEGRNHLSVIPEKASFYILDGMDLFSTGTCVSPTLHPPVPCWTPFCFKCKSEPQEEVGARSSWRQLRSDKHEGKAKDWSAEEGKQSWHFQQLDPVTASPQDRLCWTSCDGRQINSLCSGHQKVGFSATDG
ncbi:unnamed protein product [Rangifer tarandus platyrhynchus]|uniref:Uncharacterized protein n=2 Tax=Rangifer tarandus platyrhynchus TaxID=3082113 RepID=A0AC59ZT77_RANTA|nr:unnamed protein product [Rangifer tarandus platyrhynchus]